MRELIDRLVGGYEAGSISRRELLVALTGLAVGTRAEAQSARAPMKVSGINHVSIFVPDMQRSVAFYQRLFDMPVQSVQQNGTNLSAGDGNQFLGIYQVPSVPPRIDHVCFVVDDFDVDRVMNALAENGVEGRVRMREGEVAEIYFTDPDGISVQIQHPDYCGGSGYLGDRCG